MNRNDREFTMCKYCPNTKITKKPQIREQSAFKQFKI